MRLPTAYFAAIAGLWQQSFVSEGTVTSTRHIKITRTITSVQSTVYASQFRSSTLISGAPLATASPEASPEAAQVVESFIMAARSRARIPEASISHPTTCCEEIKSETNSFGHLELRSADDTTSVRHVKVTMTVESVQATVYETSVGSSASTLTSVPASIVAEVSAEASAASVSEDSVISSAEAEAMAHSTVAALDAGLTAAGTVVPTSEATSSETSKTPTDTAEIPSTANKISVSATAKASALNTTSISATEVPPIGLELRSDGDTTSTSHIHVTLTVVAQAQSTVYKTGLGSTASSTTSAPSSIVAIASSEAAEPSSSTVAVDAASVTSITETDVKSTQTALIDNEPATSSQGILTSHIVTTTAPSTHETSSVLNTSQQSTTPPESDEASENTSSTQSTRSSESAIGTSTETRNTDTTSTHSSETSPATLVTQRISTSHIISTTSNLPSTSETAAAGAQSSTTGSTSSQTSAESSAASSAAEIAADNAAGASGSDPGSFKLSKGGFAAIISVVSIGVGLGMIFLILFVIAKRRQWNVRASILRTSRRLTGRSIAPKNPPKPTTEKPTSQVPRLPVVEPRSAILPPPHQQSRFVAPSIQSRLDAPTVGYRPPFRGSAETRPGAATRFPVRSYGDGELGPRVWRREMGRRGEVARQDLGFGVQGQAQRKRPELRVDTEMARRSEDDDEDEVGLLQRFKRAFVAKGMRGGKA